MLQNSNFQQIQGFMQKIGISEMETQLYLKLLELGPTSITELAKKIEVARTTVFENVDKLINKGMITRTIKGKRKLLMAETPNKIKTIIDLRGNELDHKIKEIDDIKTKLPIIIDDINNIIPAIKSKTNISIRYYEGKSKVRLIYNEALSANEFRAYVNAKELAAAFPENVDKFISEHKKRKSMKIWEIMEDSELSRAYIEKMPKDRYSAQTIPQYMNLSVIDYMIFDDNVAIIDLKDNPTGILISNKNYYNNAKALFEFVWDMLKNYSKR